MMSKGFERNLSEFTINLCLPGSVKLTFLKRNFLIMANSMYTRGKSGYFWKMCQIQAGLIRFLEICLWKMKFLEQRSRRTDKQANTCLEDYVKNEETHSPLVSKTLLPWAVVRLTGSFCALKVLPGKGDVTLTVSLISRIHQMD